MNTWKNHSKYRSYRYQTWKYISGCRQTFILGHQCPAGTVTYLFFSIQWPLIPVTTEAAKLPMGSSMPVFISLCAGQSGIELCLFGRSGQGREQSLWGLCPVGVSCMFCVCLRVWHCFSGPWHSANTHQCLCACIQGPCSFFLLHNLWSCICVAVGFKGQPSAGLQHIQYSGVHFRWKIFVVLAIIFSTTLIKNTAVTCPKPKCSLGLYFTLGTASLWGVCTAYSLLYYSSIFFQLNSQVERHVSAWSSCPSNNRTQLTFT